MDRGPLGPTVLTVQHSLPSSSGEICSCPGLAANALPGEEPALLGRGCLACSQGEAVRKRQKDPLGCNQLVL